MGSEKLLFRLEQPHGNGDIYIAWQKGSGSFLATTGVDSMVNIFDRHGHVQERIRLQSLCSGFGWDSDGDLLGIICQSSQLVLWDANTNKKHSVDVGLRDIMTCLVWAKNSPTLAIGTAKGNMSIYNHNTSKRTPVIGKHSKKITCGAWSNENLIALGSEDKTISVSSSDGDTLRVIALRSEPSDIQFSEMKLDERVGTENTVSVVVGKRTLYLYNLLDPENPIELAFQQHYGNIVTYRWFGDGYILLGFSTGFFVAISTHIREVGQELFQVKNHKSSLMDISICNAIGRVASCGDNTIKIHDITNLQETCSVLTLPQESGITRIDWSTDGQLLAVCTQSGSLNVYVSNMPLLYAVCGTQIALLSSLTEVSLCTYSSDKSKFKPVPVSLEIEPSFIAVSPFNLAVGMNNRVWFYDLTKMQSNNSENAPLMLKDRQYLGGITSIKLNQEYASVLFEGKLQLHMIEQPDIESEDRESKMFPDSNGSNVFITCHSLTPEFLIYATDMGHIVYAHLEELNVATEFKHSIGISNLYTDSAGTRLVFVDTKSQAYVYDVVGNEAIMIGGLPNKINGVVWDNSFRDRNVFIVFDEHDVITYIYIKHSIYGGSVEKVGTTSLSSQQVPLLMHSGDVISASSGGQLTQLHLATHDTILMGIGDKDQIVLENNFNKQLALHRFESALHTCRVLQNQDSLRKLGEEAMKYLEIDLAIRAYKRLEDVAMVSSLQSIANIEDTKLLSGYMAMFVKDFDRAQSWFLNSSNPVAALEMRCDLLQWDQALNLAKRIAPEQMAYISREYAQQLEFMGNYGDAYIHYEKGLQEPLNEEHTIICKSGIARTAILSGNYKHGINTAIELNSKSLNKECAEILEKKKQLEDAANLFELSESYDQAASIYIRLKKWDKVGKILPHITSSKIHLQYAKAKEAEGKYEDAVVAYNTAKDFDNVIRLHLDHLNNPEVAIELVQEMKSVEGAKLVSRFFQRLNDYPSAIKFLILSQCTDEAYELAKDQGSLETYGEILLNSLSADEMRKEDFVKLAQHFESIRNNLLAGKYWFHAQEYEKALKHLLKAAKLNSEENEALTIAIDVIASSKNDVLEKELIEFLLGETDDSPKDPKYLFRLYMARKQYKEAAKSALIIANEEQINGNYRNAHDLLFTMYQELKHNGLTIPKDMYDNLMLLHSYILVRLHVGRNDHLRAARLLIRVANDITKFPSHIVPILTSTVIECHRSGLKHAAYDFATKLMSPEYRPNIDPRYAKKIEGLIRKPPRNGKGDTPGDPIEPLTPCPYCDKLLPESQLLCNSCASSIPFCIVTGNHVILTDFTICPECTFPAIHSEFLNILEDQRGTCPMCSEKVEFQKLIMIDNAKDYIKIE